MSAGTNGNIAHWDLDSGEQIRYPSPYVQFKYEATWYTLVVGSTLLGILFTPV